ncbi:MAG: hypothetical protein WKF37_09965 [Bryobacteraceae bacterium]
MSRNLTIVFAFVLLLRLPFLNQAIQGDDPYYLSGAQHALIDPLHPSHARYIFQGDLVDMRGHPHPTLNAWVLAGLLAIFGDVYEIPFHAAYIVFSLIAAAAMWFLARRFSPDPLWATLLFLSFPAFVVNGTSLEADLPFLGFWMAGIAFFVSGRYAWSVAALALAGLTAYQAIVATPILWAYCWMYQRKSKLAWAVAMTPLAAVISYQLFERMTSGALPAAVLAGYFESYGLQRLIRKLENAAALLAHLSWMALPVLLFCKRPRWIAEARFLYLWIAIFFSAALAIFFAGSARYLLPLAAPLAIVLSHWAGRHRWYPIALHTGVSLCLALVNYQHWDGYRQFAQSIAKELDSKRVWVNGEWGLRFYLEARGALPLAKSQLVQPGDWIVSTALGYPQRVNAPQAKVEERAITSALPLRLIGLHSRSGYSSASMGLLPFDATRHPIDLVRIDAVLERKPALSYVPMSAPDASLQIVSGIYDLEERWRWMSGKAVLLLKPPSGPGPLEVELAIPEQSPARLVTLLLDGVEVHRHELTGPGRLTLKTVPVQGSTLTIQLDKSFAVAGDHRELGAILVGAGFR